MRGAHRRSAGGRPGAPRLPRAVPLALLLCAAPPAGRAQTPAALPAVRVPLPRPPADARPGPHPIARLQASADGALLLVVRRGAGHPFAYALLEPGGKVLWQGADACCAGPLPWDLLLAPRGKEAALLWPSAAGPAVYRLLRRGAPLPDFSGGAWATDGSWLGGSMGAFAADGRRLSPPLLEPQRVSDLLVAPGPTPATLRLVRDGVRYRWGGREPPQREGGWPCARAAEARELAGPVVAPVRFSPDGRFVAWSQRGAVERVLICDSRDGRELFLGAAVSAADFLSPATVVYVSRGALYQRALPGGPEQAVPLQLPAAGAATTRAPPGTADDAPAGALSAVAAAPGAGLLFIGTHGGEVYRVSAP